MVDLYVKQLNGCHLSKAPLSIQIQLGLIRMPVAPLAVFLVSHNALQSIPGEDDLRKGRD